jgi:hypothetical protein
MGMIYRHYKGGLYFLEGYATPFSDTFYDKSKTTIEVVARAKYEATLEEVDVVIVYDKNVKSTYYAYDSNNLEGVMCFYRGLDGQYWLRTREDFYKEIEIEDEHDTYMSPRFEKVSGEYLFDTISELLDGHKV